MGAEASSSSAPADPQPAFAIRGLTKVYETSAGQVHALRGLDLDIRKGEILVLLGPSGSGKSTLLNILGGLDRASAGSVRFEGRELTAETERGLTAYRRAAVGFIFQFFNLVPSLTARENVMLITEVSRDPMAPEDALAMVGLADRMDHFPAQLSGGQQQRVAVARAIAKRPKVLLCDEPTGSLDSESGIQVLEAIVKVADDVGATTMIVSHNTDIALIGDRVIRFRDGHITELSANAARLAPREMRW
ncbi:MAG: ABC transporter ATP-binding protein [Phenylobacterium sp.]|uniref:ABC transporter ATP-binding protein n=1 Tax=Phenylobacterium sp. TaxID=1871053 RepID=UPI00391B87D0